MQTRGYRYGATDTGTGPKQNLEHVMKIGILGWDHGEVDPDSPVLEQVGRDLGHDVTLFTLDEIGFAGRASGGLDLLYGGEPAASFDAVISPAPVWDHRG